MGITGLNNHLLIDSNIQENIQAVEALMRAQSEGRHPDLRSALDLLLSAGGKRVRPTLTLLVGRMLGSDENRLVTLSAAIELLHTATLVHDDLIDGSLLRRGMPTLNSQWSPGATVLTGDFLFASAAKLASDVNSNSVMSLFAQTLTVIVNGEITQLFNSRCRASRDDYLKRIYAKTASLFETSAKSAALISLASAEVIESMRCFGYQIGMAFQIMDDILDFTGEQATIGKPVGSDLLQGLITLPTLYYIESHPEDSDGQRLVDGECVDSDHQIHRLIEAIRQSDAINKAHNEAAHFISLGLEALHHIPESADRNALESLAMYFVQRDL